MAGSKFTFVLIGFAVLGAAGGTIAALALDGGSDKNAVEADQRPVEVPKPSREVTEAEKAAVANEAGRDKLYTGDYRGASMLFREAVDRAPNPQYFGRSMSKVRQA